MSYYDFKFNTQTCKECGWVGVGNETKIGETFRDGAEYHCPECGGYFRYLDYPFHEEVLNDPRSDPIDRLQAELALRSVLTDPEADPVDRQKAELALKSVDRE